MKSKIRSFIMLRKQFVRLVLLAGLLNSIVDFAVAGEDHSEVREFFNSIRSRSLFGIGEEFAFRELSVANLSDAQRYQYTIEVTQTLLEHGMLESIDAREDLWHLSDTVVEDQLKLIKNSSLHTLLMSWRSLQTAQKDIFIAQEILAQPFQNSDHQALIAKFSQNIEELQLQHRRLSANAEVPSEGDDQQRAELRSLKRRIELSILMTEFWQLQCQANTVESLSHYSELATKVDQLLQSVDELEVEFRARLLRLRIASIQGDERALNTYLRPSDFRNRPVFEQELLFTERVRFYLLSDRFTDLFDAVDSWLKRGQTINDECSVLLLQALLKMAAQAREAKDLERLRLYEKQAADATQLVRGVWSKTAQNILQYETEQREFGTELASLKRRVDSELIAKNLVAAGRHAAQATLLFLEKEQPDLALMYGKIAFTSFVEQTDFEQALLILNDLKNGLTTPAQLAEIDLLECYLKVLRHELDAIESLESHLQQFPNSPTTNDAFLLIGTELYAQGHVAEALVKLGQVEMNSPVSHAADLRVLSIISRELKESATRSTDTKTVSLFRKMVERIVQRLAPDAQSWSADVCMLMLDCVEIEMHPVIASVAQSPSQLPENAIDSTSTGAVLLRENQKILDLVRARIDAQNTDEAENDPDQLERWRVVSRRLLQLEILSSIQRMQFLEAKLKLADVSQDHHELDELLQKSEFLSANAETMVQVEHAKLQLEILKTLSSRSASTNAQAQRHLKQQEAKAHFKIGDFQSARREYEKLLAIDPDSVEIQNALVESLVRIADPTSLKRAIVLLKSQEPRFKLGSEDWAKNRVDQVEVLILLGDKVAAKKMLGVTRTLYPNVGTVAVKDKSERLWQQLAE